MCSFREPPGGKMADERPISLIFSLFIEELRSSIQDCTPKISHISIREDLDAISFQNIVLFNSKF